VTVDGFSYATTADSWVTVRVYGPADATVEQAIEYLAGTSYQPPRPLKHRGTKHLDDGRTEFGFGY
jgi:hypothetical protein